MTRLAYVGNDHQVHLLDGSTRESLRLTGPVTQGVGAWAMLGQPQEMWSWPTFSPDGSWLLAFAAEGSDSEAGPARVMSLSIDGVRQVEWARLSEASPIYLQWHPAGVAVSVLSQHDGDLQLDVVHRDRLGERKAVASGVPLFFNWTPTGHRVLVHAGEAGTPGQLLLRDPLGDAEDVVLPRSPGSFCSPVFPSARPVYAVADTVEGVSEVVVSHIDGLDARVLVRHRGLIAVVGAPGRPWVAVAASPKGEASPYQGIEIAHLYTGEVRRLTDLECLAFAWSPAGDCLIVAAVDAPANCLCWWRVEVADGSRTRLGTFWPTRDMLFYLHYFEQYVQSHPIVSPDGRWLVYAGFPAGDGQADLSQPPRIWRKDLLQPHEPAVAVASGTFAVFPSAPVAAPRSG